MRRRILATVAAAVALALAGTGPAYAGTEAPDQPTQEQVESPPIEEAPDPVAEEPTADPQPVDDPAPVDPPPVDEPTTEPLPVDTPTSVEPEPSADPTAGPTTAAPTVESTTAGSTTVVNGDVDNSDDHSVRIGDTTVYVSENHYTSTYIDESGRTVHTVDLDCADFPTWTDAQAALDADRSDPWLLDADNDGTACEADEGSWVGDTLPKGTHRGGQVTVYPTSGVDTGGDL